MSERTRPIRKEICLNESEWNLIQHKMRQLGTRNFGATPERCSLTGTSSRSITPNRKSWLLPSAALHRMSIKFAAGSTAQGISMRMMFLN